MAAAWSLKRLLFWGVLVFLGLLAIAAFVFRDDILLKGLDPKIPYQTYQPPPERSYAERSSWAMLPEEPARPSLDDPPADVFFIHPTTFDGGRHWNAPMRERTAERFLQRVALPNYAGPFARVGRVFAPRYRQASLYAHSTLRDDARDARAFAYEDVRRAFRFWLDHYDTGRPLVVAGAEQGGILADRLIREEIAPNPELRSRLAAAYLMDTVVAADRYAPNAVIPACSRPGQAGCVVAWAEEPELNVEGARRRLARALIWNDHGRLESLRGRAALCVNPVLGFETEEVAPARRNLGATNATGLEWGARPAFLAREVAARCDDGLLRTSHPKSPSLKPAGSWADRQKIKSYNLFYVDIETDAQARVAALKPPEAQAGASVRSGRQS